MPRGSPFTALCQLAASLARPVAADLHVHSTASDGEFTPTHVIALARGAGLAAVALADHDTFAGHAEAVAALDALPDPKPAFGRGVELTVDWRGRELHLLGYFRAGPSAALLARCDELCHQRRERFDHCVRGLIETHVAVDAAVVTEIIARSASLGRRHVAEVALRSGLAKTYREAWGRFVAPLSAAAPPKLRLDFAEAVALVAESAGLTSLAHPPIDLSESDFVEMKLAGLGAVEAVFPAAKAGRTLRLRDLAARLDLAVTGGSDCHGPGDGRRAVGARGLTAEDLRRVGPSTTG